MTNAEICEHLKINISALRRYRNLYGLSKSVDHLRAQATRNSYKAREVNKNSDHEAQRNNINKLREEGRLSHHNHKSHWNNISEEKSKERRKVMSEKRKKLIADERKRIRWGFAPLTKLSILQERNKPRSQAKWRLGRMGYIFIEKWIFAYNDSTKRSRKSEEKYKDLFHFKFIQQ